MNRTDLHGLVDSLPEAEVAHAARLLDAYRRRDRALIATFIAPSIDDEEMAWINAMLDEPDPEAGRYVPFEQVLAEHKLTEDDLRRVDLAEYERTSDNAR